MNQERVQHGTTLYNPNVLSIIDVLFSDSPTTRYKNIQWNSASDPACKNFRVCYRLCNILKKKKMRVQYTELKDLHLDHGLPSTALRCVTSSEHAKPKPVMS